MKSLGIGLVCFCAILTNRAIADEPWRRHAIDDTSQGADGARPADVNGDGLPDLAVAWEEGGVIRAYLHPGHKKVRAPWPQVTVGRVKSPEDAVFVDLDGDGRTDVVSSCEKGTEAVFAHFAPAASADYLDASKWQTVPLKATVRASMWMYALPFDVDGKHGPDLIVGSKVKHGQIAWLEAPAKPRDGSAWKVHHLHDAGWVMTLAGVDFDDDGDADVLVSDRKGPTRNLAWLENTGSTADAKHTLQRRHLIDIGEREFMFASYGRVGREAQPAVLCVDPTTLLIYRRGKAADSWSQDAIPLPPNHGVGKSVAPGDLDGDGDADLVVTFEKAVGEKSGIVWLEYVEGAEPQWKERELGGPAGIKYDRCELLDLDGDGDLDVVTCEERDQLGVVWYENPHRS